MLFFLAKFYNSTIFPKLLLFTDSAQKFLSKLLYSYRYIYILAISPGYMFRDLYKYASVNAAPNREHQDQSAVTVFYLQISWRDVSFPVIFLEFHLSNM